MSKRLKILLVFLPFVIIIASSLSLNSQQVVEAYLRINQSITVDVNGNAVLTLKIPQNTSKQFVYYYRSNYPFDLEYNEENLVAVFHLSTGVHNIWINSLVKTELRTPERGSLSFSKLYLKNNFSHRFFSENKMMELLSSSLWVCENIKYDEKFSKVVLDPEEILEIKRGTCDEYSSLLIGILQDIGIPAKYEAGYAFDGKDFRPHAWVKTEIDGKLYYVDPTWCEMPVDALHVLFASLDENHYKESEIRVTGINPRAQMSDQKIDIEIINYTERPIVLESIQPIEKVVPEEGYVVAKYKLYSDYCILSDTNFGECTDGKRTLVKPVYYLKHVGFCKEAQYFVVFKTEGKNYRCRIYSKLNSGNSSYSFIEVHGNKGTVYLSVNKNETRPDDPVFVLSNGFTFTLDGQTGKQFFGKKDFWIFAYKGGDLKKVLVKVTGRNIINRDFKKYEEIKPTGTVIVEKRNGILEKIIEFFKSLLSFLT